MTVRNNYVHFQWRPTAGGKTLGPFVSPVVEENVLRGGRWSGWKGTDPNFGWRSEIAAIDDAKIRGWDPPWAPNPYAGMPNPVDSIQQRVRITIPYCCNNISLVVTSPTFTLNTYYVDNATYKIVSE